LQETPVPKQSLSPTPYSPNMANTQVRSSFGSSNNVLDLIISKITSLVCAVTFVAMLVLLYKYQLSTYWNYMGFNWAFSFPKFLLSLCIIIIISLLLPKTVTTKSVFLILATYMHFIPSLVLFAVANKDFAYFLAVIISICVFSICLHAPVKRMVVRPLSWKQVILFSFGVNVLTLVLLIIFSGFDNFNLDFSQIYEFRADAKSNLPAFMAYLRPMATKVFLPIFVILSFVSGKKTLQALAVAIIVTYFAFTNHKIIIFASISSVILYYALRKVSHAHRIYYLFLVLLFLCCIDVFLFKQISGGTELSYISSVVVRRSLMVPALLDSYYADFFLNNPYNYWADSKVGLGLVDKQFDLNIPFLIGAEYFKSEQMSANTGIIGSGFANAGYIGVAIYSALLGFIIAVLNKYGDRNGHVFVISISFTLVMGALRSSDLPSVFLTHGLMFLFIFLMFFPLKPFSKN